MITKTTEEKGWYAITSPYQFGVTPANDPELREGVPAGSQWFASSSEAHNYINQFVN
jgi:hypothetical protein